MSASNLMPINQLYKLTTHQEDGGIEGYHF
jgi:hypothetical protein